MEEQVDLEAKQQQQQEQQEQGPLDSQLEEEAQAMLPDFVED